MFKKQLFIRITIQANTSSMYTRFSGRRVKASGKDVFPTSDMLNNAHICQP